MHNFLGIFADAEGIARRKAVECWRDDVAGIPLTDALPQKRRARAPGAGIGGAGALAVSALSFIS